MEGRMKTLIGLFFIIFSVAASAACIGSSTLYSCNDPSGNNYIVNRIGNVTTVQGNNQQTGNTWSQTSNHFGDVTITNGVAANGNSWNETTTNLGGGMYTQSGVDGNGNSFSRTCTQFGCN